MNVYFINYRYTRKIYWLNIFSCASIKREAYILNIALKPEDRESKVKKIAFDCLQVKPDHSDG